MKIRYSILIFLTIFFLVLVTFPMRGFLKIVDLGHKLTFDNVEGFWWDAKLDNVYTGKSKLGDIKLNLLPLSLLSGNFKYKLSISGPELQLSGNFGISILGNYFIQKTTIKAAPIKKFIDGKPISQSFSKIDGYVEYLFFNKNGCIKAKGDAVGDLLDDFSFFSRNLRMNIFMVCQNELLKIGFRSANNNLLEGEVFIKPNFEYVLEARSKTITSKIKELSKLKFGTEPSLKLSGRLDEILDYM